MYEGELKKILKFQLLTGVQFTVSAASIASVQRYHPWDSHAFVLRVGLAAAQNLPTHHSAPCKSPKKTPNGAKVLQQLGRRGWRQL